MINFDSLSLKALVAELKPMLIGARIGKIQQPSKHELLLTVRAHKDNHKLYINVDPKYPHMAVLSKEGETQRCIEIPKTPPMFCMLLRKHMEGSKIKDIKQPSFDRIFEIYFESYSELGEKVQMVLSCEFMGKYSNIILYNYETNVILGCAHSVSSEKSREREVAGGLPYVYPPKQDKVDIDSGIKTVPLENYGYISRALDNELTSSCDNNELYDIARKAVNLENLNPSVSADMQHYSLISLDKEVSWQQVSSVNEMLDKYFGHHVFKDKFTRAQNSLLKIIKKELKHNRKLLADQQKTAQSEDKQEKHKQKADSLIMTDPQEAQKYYKLYKKAKTAALHSEEMMKKTLSDIQYLENIETSIHQAENMQDLAEIRHELHPHTTKTTLKEKIELVEFTSSDGFTILAGKNNKQNEYLLKHSHPEDLWLHTQNLPGSHVIIKCPPRTDIPEPTLYEAVYIAGYYSKGRGSSNVAVVFTKRKHVKKPPGAKPGFVIYNNEKTLWANPKEKPCDQMNSLKQL